VLCCPSVSSYQKIVDIRPEGHGDGRSGRRTIYSSIEDSSVIHSTCPCYEQIERFPLSLHISRIIHLQLQRIHVDSAAAASPVIASLCPRHSLVLSSLICQKIPHHIRIRTTKLARVEGQDRHLTSPHLHFQGNISRLGPPLPCSSYP
jgi:hypothetical protein